MRFRLDSQAVDAGSQVPRRIEHTTKMVASESQLGKVSIYCLLRHLAESHGEAPAILAVAQKTLCYRELWIQANYTVKRLNDLGIGRKDRVGIVLPNGPEMAVCCFAVACGATSAPLNPAYTAAEFELYLSDLKPKAMIVGTLAESPAIAVANAKNVPVLLLVPEAGQPAGVFRLEGKSVAKNAQRPGPAQPDDIAFVLHTSGSTSRPKIVPLTHTNLCSSSSNNAHTLRLTADDRCLNIMPLFHIHGLIGAVLSSFSVGASVVCTPGLRTPNFFNWVDEFQPTWYTAVPTMHQAILERARQDKEVIQHSRLRFIRSSSAALAPRLMEEMEHIWGVPVIEAYGLTEAYSMSINPLPPGIRKPGSVGLPAGCEISIMNDRGELLPPGVVGEVAVRGPIVMREYENDPKANASSFIGGWFRTGDEGRFDNDGYLYITGRIKDIIIRGGEIISPQEVDEVLLKHPAVEAALTFALPDPRLGEDIGAAVVLRQGRSAAETDLRSFAAQRLSDFKIPRRIVFVAEIPKGPTGKAQRIGLAARLGLSLQDSGMAPRERQMTAEPRNETEVRLVRIWKEVLRLAQVGIDSDFFELGGDSILASQVIVRIREELNAELRIYELFDAPTVSALARCIHSKRPLDRSPDPIRRLPRSGPLPLSHAQQRLRLLSEIEETNPAYMIPKALRIRGKLQPKKLRESLRRIVERHEVLHTTYPIQNGIPVQVTASDWHFDLPVMEIGATPEVEIQSLIQRLVQEEVRRPIDLSCDFPLRARLVRFNENDHLLLLCIHHIAWDGWSSAVFFHELGSFYSALTNGSEAVVPGLSVQYADYAQWEQDHFEGEVGDKLIQYWKKRLAASPSLLDLPTDHLRPAYQTFNGGLERLQLPLKLTDALRRLSRSQSTTLYMTLLAAFQVLLSRYSNQTDICVGTPTGWRSRKEVENLIGLFVNTLVIRCDLSGAPTFLGLLAQVREAALGAFDHHELPFEKLIGVLDPERSLSHSPLFQVMFQLRNFPESVMNLQGLDVSLVPVDPGTAQFDLYLEVSDTEQGLACVLNYNSALFDAATAKRMLGHYERLLESIVSDPEETIGKLGMLTEAERRELVVEWNKTQVEFPSDHCIHELFEEQVARSPEATAVVFEDSSLSYAELNGRANQLAHYLRGLGTRPGDRVVTLLERSVDLVIAELAILKCGAAYVPIDPAFPGERKQFIVTDSGAKIVLSIEGVELPVIRTVTRINVDKTMLAESVADNPCVSLNTEATAYIMYTSGSTGQPKGVMVPHRAIKRLVLNSRYARFEPSDRVAFGSNPAFDASTMEVWAPLLNGGRIVVIGQDVLLEPARFGQTLKRHGVTILWLTVGLFNQYVDALTEELARLRYLIVGGDALDPRVISRLLCGNPPQHVINGYGPTETTTFAITHEIAAVPDNARSIPIGRPIANTQVYILDGQGEPVPIGVAGEIHIGGAGVAQGYLNRPELTAERFIPDPFAAKAGARMYKTGDMGRWLEDGTIEFLGRNDRQVKIRGFRVELGEIEARLGEHRGVREAVVVAREDEPGEKRLVAYVVLAGESACTTADLRDYLKQKLPDYMVPAAWVVLPALPLTPNGKVDRKALPLPGADAVAELSTVYVAPDSETEQKIAAIWQDVLGIAKVGRNNNFFDLGGHSLLLLRVHSRLREAFNKDITMVDLFRCTTVRALAQHLAGQSDSSKSDRAQAQGKVRKDAMRRHRQLRRHLANELLKESSEHAPRD